MLGKHFPLSCIPFKPQKTSPEASRDQKPVSASLEWIPKATGYGVDRNSDVGAWVEAWEDFYASRKRQNSWEEGVRELMEKPRECPREGLTQHPTQFC